MHGIHEPAEGSIEAPLTALAELQRQGLIRHIGLSNLPGSCTGPQTSCSSQELRRLRICERISPLPN